MMHRTRANFRSKIAKTILVLIGLSIAGGANADDLDIEYGSVTYKTARLVFDADFDAGERKQVHRFGIGGGAGRKLVGKYRAAGMHIVTDLNVYADHRTTVVEVLMPSGKYITSFGEEPDVEELAASVDKRMLAFLQGLTIPASP